MVAAVQQQTDHYLQNEVSPITRICRAESGHAVDALTSAESPSRVVFVIGEAGAGKSAVYPKWWSKCGLWLAGPCLPARPHQPCDAGGGPGTGIGPSRIPGCGPRALAQSGSGLLVVDQLDAVSMVSGRNPEFFHCVQAIGPDAGAPISGSWWCAVALTSSTTRICGSSVGASRLLRPYLLAGLHAKWCKPLWANSD